MTSHSVVPQQRSGGAELLLFGQKPVYAPIRYRPDTVGSCPLSIFFHVQLNCHVCFISSQGLGSGLFLSNSLVLVVSILAAGSTLIFKDRPREAGAVPNLYLTSELGVGCTTFASVARVPRRFVSGRGTWDLTLPAGRDTPCYRVDHSPQLGFHFFYPCLKCVAHPLYSRFGIEVKAVFRQGTVVHHSQSAFNIHQPELTGILRSQVPDHPISFSRILIHIFGYW